MATVYKPRISTLDSLASPSPAVLTQAVRMIDGRAITEASNRVNPTTAAAITATGVDRISVVWLTHSAAILHIGVDAIG